MHNHPFRFLLLLALIVVPVYVTNQLLLKYVQPRRSFVRFLGYLLLILALTFGYTVIFAWLMLKLVGLQHR